MIFPKPSKHLIFLVDSSTAKWNEKESFLGQESGYVLGRVKIYFKKHIFVDGDNILDNLYLEISTF